MKTNRLHTSFSLQLFKILSGIVFFSFIPLDTDSNEYEFSNLFQYGTEFDSIKDGNGSEENDANHSKNIFELVFKETAEKKDSSAGSNGIPALKQGIHLVEVASVDFSSDRSLPYKGLKLLTNEYSADFINHTSTHFFSYLLSLTGDIAINAP